METILRKITTTLIILFLETSCSNKEKPIDLSLKYSGDKGPQLDIQTYLNGTLEGWGFIEDANGLVSQRFTATVDAQWDGGNGIVKRKFIFNEDKSDSRAWLLTMSGNDFSAVGHGFIGSARGQQYKGLAQMKYKSNKSFDGKKQEVDITETTYNIDGKSSISIIEFIVDKKLSEKMTLSLHKVKPSNNVIQSVSRQDNSRDRRYRYEDEPREGYYRDRSPITAQYREEAYREYRGGEPYRSTKTALY